MEQSRQEPALFDPHFAEPKPILILSIRKVHADRIFAREKTFELRKALPKARFERVYLYESGGAGIVGCFDVASVIRLPIAQLWTRVGTKATARDSFDAYFSGWEQGYAIEILNPLKFDRPLIPASIKERVAEFTAPQSYSLLDFSQKLYKVLERARSEQLGTHDIILRPITSHEESQYIAMVTKEISARYDEITDAFAKAILESNRLGKDPKGIFTLRKEVMSILDARGRHLGFTTLTYKIGNCVKTGPTVLHPHFRGLGYGIATQLAICEHCRASNINKLYCTCPDNDLKVIAYLLRSGFRVEAHLRAHYRKKAGELILGKRLVQDFSQKLVTPSRLPENLVQVDSFSPATAANVFRTLFRDTWSEISKELAERIVNGILSKEQGPYENKPIQGAAFGSERRPSGFVFVVPKRGGAAKAMLVSRSNDKRSLDLMVKAAETIAKSMGRRKLYFIHPISDTAVVTRLMTVGYVIEGVLDQPYAKGVTAAIAAKFFDLRT